MSSLSELHTEKAEWWSWLVSEIKNPNLTAVALFCAIGLFATINLIVRFPDLGAF